MEGGCGHTSLEMSILDKSTIGPDFCSGAAAAVFFFLPAQTETGEASATISTTASAITVLPRRKRIGQILSIFTILQSKNLFRDHPHVDPVLVAGVAKRHAVRLVLHQQIGLG